MRGHASSSTRRSSTDTVCSSSTARLSLTVSGPYNRPNNTPSRAAGEPKGTCHEKNSKSVLDLVPPPPPRLPQTEYTRTHLPPENCHHASTNHPIAMNACTIKRSVGGVSKQGPKRHRDVTCKCQPCVELGGVDGRRISYSKSLKHGMNDRLARVMAESSTASQLYLQVSIVCYNQADIRVTYLTVDVSGPCAEHIQSNHRRGGNARWR